MSSLVKKSGSIKSVENALSVLEVLGEIDGEFRLSHLSQKLNMNKSSVFRILTTFEQRGFVEQVKKSGKYRLGMGAYEVGQKFLSRMELLRKAKPIMETLARECDENVYLAVPAGQDILLLDKVGTSNPVSIMPLVGRRFSLSRCAAGKVILAFDTEMDSGDAGNEPAQEKANLANLRKLGFGVDTGSIGDGVSCLAVPVLNRQKRVLGSLCFVGPQYRFTGEKVQEYLLPRLLVAGQVVSSQLGYVGSYLV